MSAKNTLEEVFHKFLENDSIFRDRSVLTHDFIPQHFPHRDFQIRTLGEILAPALKGFKPSNLFIYGKTGTGKTAVIRYVLNILEKEARKLGSPTVTCYVNCRLIGSEYKIYTQFCKNLGYKVPFTGLSLSELFSRFSSYLDESRSIFIVVLDEIDALVKSKGDNLLYHLTRINETLNFSKVSIIGISNDLKLKESLDPRILSSLSEEEVIFNPYNAAELKDILVERAEMAFKESVIDEGTIALCAALAASEHGDARRALDLLRIAGELAEREGSNTIEERHIRRAERKIERDRVIEAISSLPLHSKLIIFSLYLRERKLHQHSITGEIFNVYKNVCSKLGINPLTQRRISGLINELDIIGLLNAQVTSFGRYGRSKKIKLNIDEDIILKVFSMDERLSTLLNSKLDSIYKFK